jgi:hypothetical protein
LLQDPEARTDVLRASKDWRASASLHGGVHHAHEGLADLLVRRPFGVEIGEGLRGIDLFLALASLINLAMRSLAVTSMARYSASCALVASAPWPRTILAWSLASLM